MSISAEEAGFPLEWVFHTAEFLLNKERAIREAASNDRNCRTVKSKDGEVPLLVDPSIKKQIYSSASVAHLKGLACVLTP